ncbi:hypothetical protein GCM10010221_06660 [Streptomyces parvus]|nr:hypothetical protein GCM10010221_06660 [Streptomyces parvus]
MPQAADYGPRAAGRRCRGSSVKPQCVRLGGWSAALPVTGGESHAAYGQGLGNQPGPTARGPTGPDGPGGAVGLRTVLTERS